MIISYNISGIEFFFTAFVWKGILNIDCSYDSTIFSRLLVQYFHVIIDILHYVGDCSVRANGLQVILSCICQGYHYYQAILQRNGMKKSSVDYIWTRRFSCYNSTTFDVPLMGNYYVTVFAENTAIGLISSNIYFAKEFQVLTDFLSTTTILLTNQSTFPTGRLNNICFINVFTLS